MRTTICKNLTGKITFGTKDKTNLSIYNTPDSGDVKEKSELIELFTTFISGDYSVHKIDGTIFKDNFSSGPIYLEKEEIETGSFVDFNVSYEMLTDKSSSIWFRVFDKEWKDKNDSVDLQLKALPKGKLEVNITPELMMPY